MVEAKLYRTTTVVVIGQSLCGHQMCLATLVRTDARCVVYGLFLVHSIQSLLHLEKIVHGQF
jgi:hypothetical protein